MAAGGVPTKPGAQKVHDPAREPGDVRSRSARDSSLTLASSSTAQSRRTSSTSTSPCRRARDARVSTRVAEASRAAHAGHQVIAALPAVGLATLTLVAAAGAAPDGGSGRYRFERSSSDGTVPLTGEAAAFGTSAPGAKAYFDYVNAKGGVQRPEDRVPLLRRRLQPRADRAAHPAARRAGPRLRDLQRRRHGEQPRDPRLPERTEGAAALRRGRLAVDRPELCRVPVDDGLPAELPRRGRRLREDDREVPAEGEDRRALREHRARPRHAHRASRGRSRGKARVSSRSRVRVHRHRRPRVRSGC